MRTYSIYEDDVLLDYGHLKDLKFEVIGLNSVLKYANSGKLFKKKYKVTFTEDDPEHIRKTPTEKAIEKIDDYANIISCLEEFGNTNLTKKEHDKYLSQLKQKYNLKVEHYKANTNYFVYAYEESNICEDWIITWLDWGKDGKSRSI